MTLHNRIVLRKRQLLRGRRLEQNRRALQHGAPHPRYVRPQRAKLCEEHLGPRRGLHVEEIRPVRKPRVPQRPPRLEQLVRAVGVGGGDEGAEAEHGESSAVGRRGGTDAGGEARDVHEAHLSFVVQARGERGVVLRRLDLLDGDAHLPVENLVAREFTVLLDQPRAALIYVPPHEHKRHLVPRRPHRA
eukprot:CAMPEP_0174901212 /NCGR_PEP_ID=MMETSP0167-20121228/33790_1 /TAXON_ID=38298 /ORGANISM="Rhodella maculata, Strain CCMP736" /LENGTH=188 /DNA_ID=CAMNT_0016142831 /DNA_START=400 /DNA_END=962 /DNA_ORIENTATION=-